MTVRYYRNGGALIREKDHAHAFLGRSGQWVPHEVACDCIYHEAATVELSVEQARKWVADHAPGINPVWV